MKALLLALLPLLIPIMASGHGNDNDSNQIRYRVTAVKNGDHSITSESNISSVSVPLALYIPNAFSPNGDGLNDLFEVSAGGIIEYSISIFSKWGEMIFESTNPRNSWDGTFGGDPVPDGAYVYYIHLVSEDNISLVKSGTVTIVK